MVNPIKALFGKSLKGFMIEYFSAAKLAEAA